MSDWVDANQPITFSSEEGIPDNHTITVRERTISIDIPTLIQNNIKTDTVTLDLDSEWDGITPVVIFGSDPDAVEVVYEGPGTIIPSQVAKNVGNVDLSVCGLNADGTVRLVTKAAPGTFSVVKSGLCTGDIPEDDATSILGQLLSAADDARTATADAKSATSEATKATEEAKTATEDTKTATSEAQKAAENANTSASGIQSAIQSANTAAESAQNAANAANESSSEASVLAEEAKKIASDAYDASKKVKDILNEGIRFSFQALRPCPWRINKSNYNTNFLETGLSYIGSRVKFSLNDRLYGVVVLAAASSNETLTVYVRGLDLSVLSEVAIPISGENISRTKRYELRFSEPIDISGNFYLDVIVSSKANSRVGLWKISDDMELIPSDPYFAVSTFPGSWIESDIKLCPYVEFITEQSYKIPTLLTEKRIVAIGDSLTSYETYPDQTYGKNWLQIFSKRTGAIPFNSSFGGTGYMAKPNSSSKYLPFSQRISDEYLPDNTEIVIIVGSVNDLKAYNGISENGIGNKSDEPNNADGSSYCANVKYTLNAIKNRFPDAFIIVSSMPPTINNNPSFSDDPNTTSMINALSDICEDMKIPFCNLYFEMKIPEYDSDAAYAYFCNNDGSKDSVHLNERGHRLMSEILTNFIMYSIIDSNF